MYKVIPQSNGFAVVSPGGRVLVTYEFNSTIEGSCDRALKEANAHVERMQKAWDRKAA